MFDDLSKNLSGLIKKIVTGTTIDKKSVEEVLQDLKRILLQSDVDMKLTDELVNNIRKKCLEEKIPAGMTLREHVIKTIYNELVVLLGGKPESLLGKKRIMLVGLFGSGKCIHKESLIPLANGEILSSEELYKRYKNPRSEEKLFDGYKIDLNNSDVEIFSFNPKSLKIEKKKISTLWKLNAPKKLIEVTLDNGKMHKIIVTPEHPFYVMQNGKIEEIMSENLAIGSHIAVPNKLPLNKNNSIDLRKMLLELPENFVLLDKSLGKKIKKIILAKYRTLKEADAKLKLPVKYSRFTRMLKYGIVPIYLLKKIDSSVIFDLKEIKLKYMDREKHSKKFIKLPLVFNQKFAEFLGYVLSEGNIDRRSVVITNSSKVILNRVSYLSKSLFGLNPTINTDKRNIKVKKVVISSTSLVLILTYLFEIKSKNKSQNVVIPDIILKSPNQILKEFIKAYFDGERSVNRNTRYLEISSASKLMIWQLGLSLLRFGILSTYSQKRANGKNYYRLFVHGLFSEKFSNEIKPLIYAKQKRLEKVVEIGKRQSAGKLELIPLGNMLREIRESKGISIGELQEKFVNSYGNYERKGIITRSSLAKYLLGIKKSQKSWRKILKTLRNKNGTTYTELLFGSTNRSWLNATLYRMLQLSWLNQINENFKLSELGQQKLSETEQYNLEFGDENIDFLNTLVNSDVSWIKVIEAKQIKNDSDYVYDLTVDDFHNFVANGIIVHNTTTAGKLAKYFSKQGLRPALVTADFHRPAALDQLAQIGKQINVPVLYEKDPYTSVKKGLEKFTKYDTIIFDTAGRNALDAQLAGELKKLKELIKPDEVLLVIPADLGKVARTQAEEFHKLAGVTGVIITKMDGTAKAGGALAATSVTGAKVKFIGIGEKIEEFELYDPQRFVSRLLGLGDLQTLLEKAKEADIKKESVEKLVEGKFNLNDFMEQIEGMQKMGPLGQIANMIPGFGMMKLPENLMEKQEEKMKHFKFIMQSMNKKEKENPDSIDASRVKRIAKGSGRPESEVRELLDQYDKMKKLMKTLGGKAGLQRGALKQLAKQFGLKM